MSARTGRSKRLVNLRRFPLGGAGVALGASVASLAASGRRHHYQGAGPRQLPRPRQPPSPRHPWRPGHCAGPPQQPDAPGRPLLALAACRAHVCRGHGHQQPPSALTLTCCGCRSWTRFKSSGIWSLTVPLRASMLDGPQHHVISGGGSPGGGRHQWFPRGRSGRTCEGSWRRHLWPKALPISRQWSSELCANSLSESWRRGITFGALPQRRAVRPAGRQTKGTPQ